MLAWYLLQVSSNLFQVVFHSDARYAASVLCLQYLSVVLRSKINRS